MAAGVPKDSPLRRCDSLLWACRSNDEGVPHANGFHGLVGAGKIRLIAPARAERYNEDGHSVVLTDGRLVKVSAVILATGFRSSWTKLFDGKSYAPVSYTELTMCD